MTKPHRGFGFVHFREPEAGAKAAERFNGAVLLGRTIKVELPTDAPPTERTPFAPPSAVPNAEQVAAAVDSLSPYELFHALRELKDLDEGCHDETRELLARNANLAHATILAAHRLCMVQSTTDSVQSVTPGGGGSQPDYASAGGNEEEEGGSRFHFHATRPLLGGAAGAPEPPVKTPLLPHGPPATTASRTGGGGGGLLGTRPPVAPSAGLLPTPGHAKGPLLHRAPQAFGGRSGGGGSLLGTPRPPSHGSGGSLLGPSPAAGRTTSPAEGVPPGVGAPMPASASAAASDDEQEEDSEVQVVKEILEMSQEEIAELDPENLRTVQDIRNALLLPLNEVQAKPEAERARLLDLRMQFQHLVRGR